MIVNLSMYYYNVVQSDKIIALLFRDYGGLFNNS